MQEIKPNQDKKTMSKIEASKKLEAQKERDLEMVTGMFRYIEKPGQTLHFRFKPPYAGCEFTEYHLEDGKRYRLIRAVARHLNQNVHYLEYAHLNSKMGSNITMAVDSSTATGQHDTYKNMYSKKRIPRCEFRSLEFMDDDISAKPDIVEVAYM